MSKKKNKSKINKRKNPSSKPKRSNISNSSSVFENKILPSILLILSLMWVIVIRLGHKSIPLDRDEGSYLYIGKAILNGLGPYKDFYEMKPPGLFYNYAFFDLLFGHGLSMLHIGLIFIILITGYFMYKIGQNLSGSAYLSAFGVLCFFVLSLNDRMNGFAILSEHFLMLWVCGSFYFLFSAFRKNKRTLYVLSGVCMGMSLSIRQHAVLFLLVLILTWLFKVRKEIKHHVKPILYWMAGAVSCGLFFILLVAIFGSLGEMWYYVVERPNSTYNDSISLEDGKTYFLLYLDKITSAGLFFWCSAALGFLGIWALKIEFWKKIFLFLFILAGVISIVPGLRFYGHYWLMMVPAISLLFVIPFQLVDTFIKNKYSWIPGVSFVILLGFFIHHNIQNSNYYFKLNGHQISGAIYGDNPFNASQEAADFLKPILKKEDRVFVLGSEPQLYYYLDKLCEISHMYIGFTSKPSVRMKSSQDEVINYLKNEKPDYLIQVQHAFSWGMKPNSDQSLYQYAYSLAKSNYESIAYFEIETPFLTRKVIGEQAKNYQPRTQKYLIIYKLKS